MLGQCLTQDSHGWIVGLHFAIQSLHGLLKTLTVGFRTYVVLLGTSTVVTWILMMLFRTHCLHVVCFSGIQKGQRNATV